MPFDKDSGLVYTERTVKAGRRVCRQHDPAFARGCVGVEKEGRPRGRRTLEQQATRQLLANLNRLDEDSFSTLPEPWVRKLYDKILSAQLLSPNVWKLFSRSTVKYQHRWTIACKCEPLSYFVETLNSPKMTWLSSIRLRGESWEEAHLASLCELDNLQSLHIETYSHKDCLTDRLIRQWLQRIDVVENWKHFRLLTARGQKLLTPNGLKLLSQLKSMELVILADCGIDSQHTKKGLLRSWRHLDCQEHASYLDASMPDDELFSLLPKSSTTHVEKMPCIEARIGFNELMYQRGYDPFASHDLVLIRDHCYTEEAPAPAAPAMHDERTSKRARFKGGTKKQNGYLDMITSIQH